MRGYLRGLSSPSGTERMATFTLAPVSNSAGHTRLPTFSRMARSSGAAPASAVAASSSARPWRHIAASRWHMPPVCSCTATTPVSAMVRASTSESMSASITPMDNSSLSAATVRRSVVVLPEPGLLMRFSRKVPRACSSSRRASAARSLLANTLCFTSMTRTRRSSAVVAPDSFAQAADAPPTASQVAAAAFTQAADTEVPFAQAAATLAVPSHAQSPKVLPSPIGTPPSGAARPHTRRCLHNL